MQWLKFSFKVSIFAVECTNSDEIMRKKHPEQTDGPGVHIYGFSVCPQWLSLNRGHQKGGRTPVFPGVLSPQVR